MSEVLHGCPCNDGGDGPHQEWCRIADLERQLAEANQRADLAFRVAGEWMAECRAVAQQRDEALATVAVLRGALRYIDDQCQSQVERLDEWGKEVAMGAILDIQKCVWASEDPAPAADALLRMLETGLAWAVNGTRENENVHVAALEAYRALTAAPQEEP